MSEPLKTYGWPSDDGACKLYRTTFPAEALSRAGHDARVCKGTRLEVDVRDDPERLIIIQRSSNPSARAALSRMKAKGRPFVFDVDDWLWGLDPENPAAKFYSQPAVIENLSWMVRNATAVTCSTHPLAGNIADSFGVEATVLPNALPDDEIRPDLTEREPTVLWRGSPTHRHDVEVVGEALRRLESDGVRIVLAGADYRGPLKLSRAELLDELILADEAWAKRARRATARVAVDHEGQVIAHPGQGMSREFRRRKQRENRKAGLPPNTGIGVVPSGWRQAVWLPPMEYLAAVRDLVRPTVQLAPLADTKFNASKSHIAALEGHAVGAVVVASDVPAYRDHMAAGGGELASDNPAEWYAAIRSILDMSHSEWSKHASAGADEARRTSVDSLAEQYEATYRKAMA